MAHVLELPYQGNDISMYILLPPFVKEDGVATILKRLTLEKFRSIVDENSTLLPRTVQVSLPKFSLEHTIELVPVSLARINSSNSFVGVGCLTRSLPADPWICRGWKPIQGRRGFFPINKIPSVPRCRFAQSKNRGGRARVPSGRRHCPIHVPNDDGRGREIRF